MAAGLGLLAQADLRSRAGFACNATCVGINWANDQKHFSAGYVCPIDGFHADRRLGLYRFALFQMAAVGLCLRLCGFDLERQIRCSHSWADRSELPRGRYPVGSILVLLRNQPQLCDHRIGRGVGGCGKCYSQGIPRNLNLGAGRKLSVSDRVSTFASPVT